MARGKFRKYFKENIKIPYLPCSSKSYAHRFIILSYILDKTLILKDFSLSKDALMTLNSLYKSCHLINFYGKKKIPTLFLQKENKLEHKKSYIDESGSTLRFLIPMLMDGKKHKIIGKKSLFSRPLDYYESLFKDENIKYKRDENSITFEGEFKNDKYFVDITKSTQFASGMMMAGVDKFEVYYNDGPNEQYITQTKDAIKIIKNASDFSEINVPEDMSNRAFFEVLNYFNKLSDKMPNKKPMASSDMIIKKWLYSNVKIFDLSDNLDLAPIFSASLAIKSNFTGEKYEIRGVKNLCYKESNRLLEIKNVLRTFGYQVSIYEDKIKIFKRKDKKNVIYYHPTDHRIFHMCLILSLFETCEVVIDNINCLKKSHFELYNYLRGKNEF